ncbi:ABC transporter substrate-binding protein [Vibrio sp. SCSIO 43135]|uniref:substrate-binding periplasmic protein n=1 Tax=Vibrio sp. SCSIO 43135 TaxID=2819096 RepID=UPI0020757E27|nr:ABC transporter substrate-binding protein [Vibrio sp. SCSIO 43135]USD42404.1 ABC transporter substrate-binding protein [Vibrio sp. SCSIO 43135]
MRTSSVLIMLFALLLSGQSIAKQLNELTYLTEEYPPYNFTEGAKVKGIAVDLLLAASKESGNAINIDDIHVQPWARAYRSTLIKLDTVLFSTTRTQLREHLFQWVGPLSTTRIVVMAKNSTGITIDEPRDLIKYRIGVIRDDVGEQLLLELGVPRDSMQESSYAKTLAEQLQKERIDLWAYEENVAKWWILQTGYNPDEFSPVFVLQEGELYYAFNKDIDRALIDELQQAIDKVKITEDDNGVSQYQAIVNKYK